jgi:sporulation protein YlmC with PRC-barrel domain
MTMQQQRGENFATHESSTLIASNKVEGTPVYKSDGEKIGKIEHVMIEKVSGKVAYAILSFGGFMGMGSEYYPLPWNRLKYSERLGGYELNVTEAQLKNAPKYTPARTWDWADRKQDRAITDYYGRF